ncbi:hypothetical protein B6U99_02415 [Candidatus Geothermarchaeota archaeon ex4572_27]|nr:MAG: hypothetical protein B6U99_02415 [Candidatus Geothermarchaeota archaeon ex4572_27]
MVSHKWLGWRREREIFKICQRHFDKVIEVVEGLKELIERFSEGSGGEVKEAFERIFKLEREADSIKESIIEELSRGPLHPIDREDIMRLILTCDDIAAHAKSAGRKLTYVDPSSIPKDIREGIKELVAKSLDAVRYLRVAMESLLKNPREAIKNAERVERIEEEVDEYRVGLIARILEWGDRSGSISTLLMVKEAIENIENMTDRAEDTADVVRGLAVVG